MYQKLQFIVLSSALFGLIACGNEERDRPSGLEKPCEGASCLPPSGQGGSHASGGSGGSSGSGGSGASTGAPLHGRVQVLDEGLNGLTQPYLGVAEVMVEAQAGGFIQALSDSEGRFELEGVSSRAGAWAGARVEGSGDFLGTWQPVDALEFPQQNLSLYRRSGLELNLAVANTASVLDPLAGHILVRFIDAQSGFPKLGVGFVATAGAELILFDDGNVLSANVATTGSQGYALLVNIPVAPYPGQLVPLSVDDGSQVVPIEARVARDSITLFDFEM